MAKRLLATSETLGKSPQRRFVRERGRIPDPSCQRTVFRHTKVTRRRREDAAPRACVELANKRIQPTTASMLGETAASYG